MVVDLDLDGEGRVAVLGQEVRACARPGLGRLAALKIVQCGEKYFVNDQGEVTHKGGLEFCTSFHLGRNQKIAYFTS